MVRIESLTWGSGTTSACVGYTARPRTVRPPGERTPFSPRSFHFFGVRRVDRAFLPRVRLLSPGRHFSVGESEVGRRDPTPGGDRAEGTTSKRVVDSNSGTCRGRPWSGRRPGRLLLDAEEADNCQRRRRRGDRLSTFACLFISISRNRRRGRRSPISKKAHSCESDVGGGGE